MRAPASRTALRLGATLVALGALAFAFRDLDVAQTASILSRVGPGAILILLPYALGSLLDTLGWRTLFAPTETRPHVLRLWSTRVSSEAVLMSMAFGPVLSESLTVYLLGRARVDAPTAVASLVARRRLLMTANGLYLMIGLLLAYPVIDAVGLRLVGVHGLAWGVVGLALALVTMGWLVGLAARHGQIAARIHTLLSRVRLARVRRWLERHAQRFAETDRHLGQHPSRPAAARALLLFLLAWLTEAAETILIFRLLGVDIASTTAFSMEMLMGFLRSLVFVVPAGLGVQELGYTAFLGAIGVPDATEYAAAFSILKRGKELCWVLAGYAAIAMRGATPVLHPTKLHKKVIESSPQRSK